MTEIEHQFCKELQELLNRYKNSLSNPTIMRIAQPIFTKTIGIRDNPDRLNVNKVSELKHFKPESLEGEFKWVD